MKNIFPAVEFPRMYRAIGILEGKYLSETDDFKMGNLVTSDNFIHSVTLCSNLASKVKDNPEKLDQVKAWLVWPKTNQASAKLEFKIIRGITQSSNTKLESIDYFQIRGILEWQKDGELGIYIRNNARSVEFMRREIKPFIIILKGYLPKKSIGEFWELDVFREGGELVVEDGQLIEWERIKLKKDKETPVIIQDNESIVDSTVPLVLT